MQIFFAPRWFYAKETTNIRRNAEVLRPKGITQ